MTKTILILLALSSACAHNSTVTQLKALPDYRLTQDLQDELCEVKSDCEAFKAELNVRGISLEALSLGQTEDMGSF